MCTRHGKEVLQAEVVTSCPFPQTNTINLIHQLGESKHVDDLWTVSSLRFSLVIPSFTQK